MNIVRIDTQLKRVWVFNKRLHHGLVGCGLLLTGLALIIHDFADIPWIYDDSEH